MSTPDAHTLARRAVRGTLAVGAANVAARAVGLAAALYLMHVVPPRDFGVVEYAVALLAIAGSLADWGFSQAAVHRQEQVEETFATYFALRLLMAGAVVALVLVSWLVFGNALAARTRFGVLLALGGVLLVDAACDAPAARLARAMRFGRLAAVDVSAAAAGAGAGVALAALGYGLWALVGYRAVQSAVRAAGLGAASVERPRLGFHAEAARWLVRFGLPLWVGSLATTWVLKYDDLVVGSLRGSRTLGYYGRAYALALLPLALVSGVLTRVSFPLYARLQGQRERLSEAFRIASGTTFRLAAPLAVAMALVVPDFLAVMGWAQWEPMVPMFRWLLVYAVGRPLMDDAGGLLTAVGRPRVTGHTLAGEAGALLVLCPLLTWRFGAQGAAASVGAVVVAGLVAWYTVFLPRFVNLATGRMLVRPALAVAAAGVAGWAAGAALGGEPGLGPGAAKLAATGAAYAGALLALDGPGTVADLRALRRHALGGRSPHE